MTTIKEEIKWLPAILTFGIPFIMSIIAYMIIPSADTPPKVIMIFLLVFLMPILLIAGTTELSYVYRKSARIDKIKDLIHHIKFHKRHIENIKNQLSINPSNIQYLVRELVSAQKDLKRYEEELRDIRAVKVAKIDDEVDRNVYNYLIETNQDALLEEYIMYKK